MSCGSRLRRQGAQLGQSYGVHRQYKQWNNWSGVAKDDPAGPRRWPAAWVSFKPPLQRRGGLVGRIANGTYDADIKALAETLKANDDKPVLGHLPPRAVERRHRGRGQALGRGLRAHPRPAQGAGRARPERRGPADPAGLDLQPDQQDGRTRSTGRLTPCLERAPFLGIDMYQDNIRRDLRGAHPRIIDWMADRGFPNKMVGIGETGSTCHLVQRVQPRSGWTTRSRGSPKNTDKVGVVSYFNPTANSKSDVYWPLDESGAKMTVFRKWLDSNATIN